MVGAVEVREKLLEVNCTSIGPLLVKSYLLHGISWNMRRALHQGKTYSRVSLQYMCMQVSEVSKTIWCVQCIL